DPVGAKKFLTEMLAAARQLGSSGGISSALTGLAWLLSEPNSAGAEYDLGAARVLVEESLSLMREMGDRRGMTHSLFQLGCIAHQLGDLNAAQRHLAECRSLDLELGVKGGLVLQALGDLFLEAGDYAAARRSYSAFVTEREEIGERWGIVRGLYGLGKVALAAGEMER